LVGYLEFSIYKIMTSAKKKRINFYSGYLDGFVLFCFVFLLLPNFSGLEFEHLLCSLEVMRVNNLVLFLILKEKFSSFDR
jgi:hypothetical protein